jgi:VanZ family protein
VPAQAIGASRLIVFAASFRLSASFWELPPIQTFSPSARSTERFQESWKPLGEEMQWLLRIVCVGYVVYLTLLLFTADPSRLIGVEEKLPWALQVLLPAAHAISFLVLAVLLLTSRWPVPRWGIVLIMAIYGGMTEILQGFFPPRTPEWMDWFQDLGGIAAGTAICWALATLFHKSDEARRSHESV